MSVERRSPSLETRPLLRERPPSYRSTDNETPPPTPTSPEAEPPLLNKFSRFELWWILLGLWSGVLLGAFDGTVVATLLTPIGSEFEASHEASYIGTSYLLSVCCFTPLYGRLADILGRKGAMLLALSLFGSGTILCGMAPSMKALIVARTVAGMGGGGVMTVSSIAVTDLIPLQQRGLYQGVSNVLYGLGAALGGPLGGWANDNFGWRSAFYMQAPVLIFSFVTVATKVNIRLPDEVSNQKISEKLRRVDFLGSITLVGAVGSLLLGFDIKSTEDLPWQSPIVVACLFSSIFLGCSFIWVEKNWALCPVMPLRLVAQRTPLAVSISNLLLSMGVFSMLYSAPIYFLTVHSDPSTVAGFYLLPHSLCIPAGSLFAGWYMRKTGQLYYLTILGALMTLSASAIASFWTPNQPSFHFWLDLLPQGLGFACFITTTLIALISTVDRADMPVATGLSYLFRTTGQTLGVSLGGAVLQTVLLHSLRRRISGPGSEDIIYAIRHSAQIIPTLEPHLRKAAINSYADALRVVFICQAAVCLLGFLASLPIQAGSLSSAPRQPEQQNQEPNCEDPENGRE